MAILSLSDLQLVQITALYNAASNVYSVKIIDPADLGVLDTCYAQSLNGNVLAIGSYHSAYYIQGCETGICFLIADCGCQSNPQDDVTSIVMSIIDMPTFDFSDIAMSVSDSFAATHIPPYDTVRIVLAQSDTLGSGSSVPPNDLLGIVMRESDTLAYGSMTPPSDLLG